MILSDIFLHLPTIINGKTSKKLLRRQIQQHFPVRDLRRDIGLVTTTIKPDVYDHYQSEAVRKASGSLSDLEAVTSQSITSVTRISNTTLSPTEHFTTHSTMTSNIVSALMNNHRDGDYHAANNRIMVLVLIGIFVFISLFITTVVVVMCRKKNSVFMLQKCEQESDLEMDDMEDVNIENDTSESEYETLESVTDVKRSESYPCLGKLKYIDESLTLDKHKQKTVDFNLFKKSRSKKSVDTQSPSSTPLLFNKNSGTGSSDILKETNSDNVITNHSLDKQTASTSSDKFVISLDKFSLHNQQTDTDCLEWKSSDRHIYSKGKQKLVKSRTFDTSVTATEKYPKKIQSSKKGKQPQKSAAKTKCGHNASNFSNLSNSNNQDTDDFIMNE